MRSPSDFNWILRLTSAVILGYLCTPAFSYAPYGAAVIDDGPIGYWNLDEDAGATNLVAENLGTLRNTADGIYFGDDIRGDDGPDLPGLGPDNQAIRLGSVIGVSGVEVLEPILDDLRAFTLEGWINPAQHQLSNRAGLFGQNDAIEFGFIGPSYIQYWAELPSRGGLHLESEYEPNNNEWHHVAITADGETGDVFLYIDAVEQTLVGNSPSLIELGEDSFGVSEHSFFIGGGAIFGGDTQYVGAIDEVAVFDKFLTQEQISAHFEAALTEPTLEGGIDFLIGLVGDTSLTKGPSTSLLSKLRAAEASAGAGGPNTLNVLKAFVHEVDALSGKKLDPSEADRLKAEALDIIGQFGPGSQSVPEPSGLVLLVLGVLSTTFFLRNRKLN